MVAIRCRDLAYSYVRDFSSPFADDAARSANANSDDSPADANSGDKLAGTRTLQLSDINLTIPTGSVTLLVGASGSGKSTLLRTFNGLIPHFYESTLTGTIEVFGQTVAEQPLHDAGRTSAMIFQNPRTQFFTSYVDTEMAFSLENYGVDPAQIRSRIATAATQAGVTHLLDRKLDTLSGGELQRVACACALVADVDLLLFDEPTSNLSPRAVGEFAQLVANLKRLGKTLVIAEHRLHPFKPSVDRVYRVAAGQIVEEFDGAAFFGLADTERRARGLRSLTQIEPGANCTPEVPTALAAKATAPAATTTPDSAPMPHSLAAGLTVENLRFAYPDGPRILDLPELTFPAGVVTAIAGENGVGKTTLARLICGLEKLPPAATITLDGTRLRAKARLRRCGMVMQDVRRQLFSASAAEEVRLGLQLSDDDVRQLLARLDLAELADRHPLSLSGGQAQRLVVAALVAAGDDVVIFDEPTSGVDYEHLCLIADLLRELARQGRVVVVITHDAELIDSCADHIITLTRPDTTSPLTDN
ncbi:MAG: energy-coupling factor ABC transporter ATP-binding protein [Bowdeniella nasicola]|nr:energy-coupling factor ABC transporter ATP-binding protein [Bowdeniella nasicola]